MTRQTLIILVAAQLSACSLVSSKPEEVTALQTLAVWQIESARQVPEAPPECKKEYQSARDQIQAFIGTTLDTEIAQKESRLFSKVNLAEDRIPPTTKQAVSNFLTCGTNSEILANEGIGDDIAEEILKWALEQADAQRKASAAALRKKLDTLLWKEWGLLRAGNESASLESAAPFRSLGTNGVPVISRTKWASKPRITSKFHKHSGAIDTIVLHHSGAAVHTTGDPKKRIDNSIRSWHMEAPGGHDWGDVAYHYIIDAKGAVYEGRPMSVVGRSGTQYDLDRKLLILPTRRLRRKYAISEREGYGGALHCTEGQSAPASSQRNQDPPGGRRIGLPWLQLPSLARCRRQNSNWQPPPEVTHNR